MSRKRKYTKGPAIPSLAFFGAWIEKENHVYYRDKFQHHGWARGWQVGYVLFCIRHGYLFMALPVLPGGEE